MDLQLRLRNYLREMNVLTAKVRNARYDPTKRRRCQERLDDLTGRLLPQLQQTQALSESDRNLAAV